MKRKMEHMPNMTVIGNAFTLYSTTQTNKFSGMRKKFMIVLLASSGIYCDLIFMIDGQKMPTHDSKVQKPSSCREPPNEMPPPFTEEGDTRMLVATGRKRVTADTENTICI